MLFPVVTYRCEGWTIKKAEHWRTDAFELWCWRKFLRVSWIKKIKPVNSKGNQLQIFIGRTDTKVEAPVLWPPDRKSQFIGKDPDAGKDWGHEEKEATENEMVEWHHQFNGHEFERTPGNSEGQGSLECCSPWGHKELDMTEWLNNNNSTWEPTVQQSLY